MSMSRELYERAMRFLMEGEVQVSVDGKTVPASSFPRKVRKRWARDLAKNEMDRMKKESPNDNAG